LLRPAALALDPRLHDWGVWIFVLGGFVVGPLVAWMLHERRVGLRATLGAVAGYAAGGATIGVLALLTVVGAAQARAPRHSSPGRDGPVSLLRGGRPPERCRRLTRLGSGHQRTVRESRAKPGHTDANVQRAMERRVMGREEGGAA